MRTLELLSPARDAATARIAILAGADAIYIGAPAFGARAAATNSVADIAAVVCMAHKYRVRVYVTMNTILRDDELAAARALVWQLYAAGVDALIVQDMAYLEMDLPPIALHASTQCDIRTPQKAAFLAAAGFSQLVLPREFSLEQIRTAAEAAKVPVEVFVHGALCVSYSGDCQAGFVATGRSANRGECPQMCRLPYELIDGGGNTLGPERHYLSLRDFNQLSNLEALADAGARSFKIEGRLKDIRYVANVTAAYSQALDKIIESNPDCYKRASAGTSICDFTPNLDKTFNRGYTQYFTNAPITRKVTAATMNNLRMAAIDSPKNTGVPVATVVAVKNGGKCIEVKSNTTFTNGDGLGFFDGKRGFIGFRLNRAEGYTLYPAVPQPHISIGDTIYRNSDKAFNDRLDAPDAGCRRTIGVKATLRTVDAEHYCIELNDERGVSVSVIAEAPFIQARTPQEQARRRIMAKLGDTIYTLADCDDHLGDRFIAASTLAEARRSAIAALDAAADATYVYDRRRSPAEHIPSLAGALSPNNPQGGLTYHDNVANTMAEHFYRSLGATKIQPAIEVILPEGELQVMHTRYCLRRELGACLHSEDAGKLPAKIYLRNSSGTYRLDCDCASCTMRVVKTK